MKSTGRLLVPVLALSMLASAAGPATAASRSDAEIEASINNSHVFKEELHGDAIKVESRNGVVTLTGTVAAEHHKNLANGIASAQAGVRSVENRMAVREEGPLPGTDAWLSAKVKTVLLFHRSVSAVHTEVSSESGIVTLKGSADSQAQKDLTAEYALDVEGVKGVVNLLTVSRKSERGVRLSAVIDDSSITARVKLALLLHRSTSALNTGVETVNGAVTLSGTAENRAEVDLAGKIAADVNDVKSVKNRIRVEGGR